MSWEAPPRKRRRWAAPAWTVVVVVAVGAIAIVGRPQTGPELRVGPPGADLPDTAVDGSRADDALVGAPPGPVGTPGSGRVLDAPDLTVVIADFSSRLQLIDLAAGTRRNIPVFTGGTRRPDAMQIVGDSVILDAGGRVLRYAAGREGAPQELARNHRSIPTVDPAAVWIRDDQAVAVGGVASRVGFDGVVTDRIPLPALAEPLAGTADGLVIRTPGTVSRIDVDGSHHLVARGQALASDGTNVARLECAADLSCGVTVGTVEEPDRIRVTLRPSDVPVGLYEAPQGRFSPDGRWLALPVHRELPNLQAERSSVAVIDVALGTEIDRIPGSALTAPVTPFAWSPDSRWLGVSSGTRLHLWSVERGRAAELDLRVPPTFAVALR